MTDQTSDDVVSVVQETVTRDNTNFRRKKFVVGRINKASYKSTYLSKWKLVHLKWRQTDDDHFAWIVSSWKNPGTPEGDEVFNTARSRMSWGSMFAITYFSSMTITSLR